jgi:hypothetical protein
MNKLRIKYPNSKVILTGDFNHLPLDSLRQQFQLRDLVNFDTRNSSRLDLILSDIEEYSDATKLAPVGSSDHCSILLKGRPVSNNKYKYIHRRPNNESIRQDVLYDIACTDWSPILEEADVDKQVDTLHHIVNGVLDKNCPMKKYRARQDNPTWATPLIQKLIRARDRAYKNGCKSWQALKHLIRKLLRKKKVNFVNTNLNNACSSKKWWTTLKQLENKSITSSCKDSYIINDKCMPAKTLCDELKVYYVNAGGPYINDPCDITPDHPITHDLQQLSIGQVKSMLGNIDPSKATSKQDFPSWVSKYGSSDLCVPVCHIFNTMLRTKRYPKLWKNADILPIPKVKSPSALKDFRPISLLFHIGKLAEQVIIDKMRGTLDSVIHDNQFGYRSGVSTTDALVCLLDDFTKFLDSKNVDFIETVCLDFSKAFDRLQPDILIRKMVELHFNANIIALIKDFLSNRRHRVMMDGQVSDYVDVLVGTPQGTKLGPLLWLIYINDLSFTNCMSIKYADDTTVYKPISVASNENIQSELNVVQDWADSNGMLLNAAKTQVLHASLKKEFLSTDLTISNSKLLTNDCVKFLGINVDKHLNFSSHVDCLVRKCNSRLFFMRSFKRCGMNNNGLRLFYVSKVRSLLSFSSPAWYHFLSKNSISKLETVQKSACKIILPDCDAYNDRLVILNLPSLEIFVNEQSLKLFSKIKNNINHPLYSRLSFINRRTSSRRNFIFSLEKCRTEKRKRSFLQLFMKAYNEL